ncbi:DNA polymerase III subunit alpha [Aeribacillus composti]|uniref:DNA polymerase III subunit alpha n=1 Tax=Aeribacillus composti TaxID=1868734 RepID=UPI002E1F8DF5|nr:DNA polymerase III subunit alpha [Aeribacillus composti]
MPFVHLQVKSAYSLLTSAAGLDKLVRYAKKTGQTALALTDHHVMYGAISFYKICKEHGIKPIFGLTATVIIKNEPYPFVLLAKNNSGYRNLLKLSSLLQTKFSKGLPLSFFKQYSRDLFVITPGRQGLIEQLLINGQIAEAGKAVEFFQSMLDPNSFYISLQNHGLPEEQQLNEKIAELRETIKVPIVATNDVLYVEKDDAFAHRCLLAIKDGTTVEEQDAAFACEYYLKSPAEMINNFANFPDSIENTVRIASECHVEIELGKTKLPKYPFSGGLSSDDFLEQLCFEGLRKKVTSPSDEYVKRLSYELSVIKKMNFSDYFLIVWDFMKYAHEKGIVTGPGRGSAAGSLVAYVLDITNVDPIRYNLLFERFLNPERVSMPDIDIDFPDTRRDEMIEYVARKYGKGHVAQIITFGTFAAKAAIRDVAKALGASNKEVDVLAKHIPSKLGITLREAFEQSAAFRNILHSMEKGKEIFETALKLEGLPRHVSTHAAGVVLSDHPLTEVIPIQNGHHDIYLTQYSMDFLEEIGLLKIDFLGLRNLTLIEDIKRLIERYEGTKLSVHFTNYDDEKTFSLLSEGNTTGVFQFESEGMRKVLQKLKPTNLEDLVAVNALYRPGPMENIPVYIERKHGRMPVEYLHKDLQPILEKTYGVIVYQEQIMEIAAKMAGFSLGEADLLRRAVGKKIKTILDENRNRFIIGCLKKGYDEKTANKVYDLIVKFANYGFNRSHAVAYSMIAYQLAYLKAHYPLYFMAALMSSIGGNQEKLAQYVREASEMGITILPPSIHKSGFSFLVENGSIRFGLASIKNVGIAAMKEIAKERKKKPFEDLFDFCIRMSSKAVNRRTIEALIFSGAMDDFGQDRATLLASIDVALEHAELFKMDEKEQIVFPLDDLAAIKPKYVEVEPFTIEEKLKFEKETLGFYLSSHPIQPYDSVLKQLGAVRLMDLSQWIEKKVHVGAYVTNVKAIRTKSGQAMAFLNISDQSGDVEAVLFPNEYAKFSGKIKEGNVYLLTGKPEIRNEHVQYIIQDVKDISEFKRQRALFLKIADEASEKQKLLEIKKVLQDYPGSIPVFIYHERKKKAVKLPETFGVQPSEQCLNRLRALLGERNVALRE